MDLSSLWLVDETSESAQAATPKLRREELLAHFQDEARSVRSQIARQYRLVTRRALRSLEDIDDTQLLLFVNIVVYCAWLFSPYGYMMRHFVVSRDNLANGRIHTLLTSAFSHAEAPHLGMNMITLMSVGPQIIDSLGARCHTPAN